MVDVSFHADTTCGVGMALACQSKKPTPSSMNAPAGMATYRRIRLDYPLAYGSWRSSVCTLRCVEILGDVEGCGGRRAPTNVA